MIMCRYLCICDRQWHSVTVLEEHRIFKPSQSPLQLRVPVGNPLAEDGPIWPEEYFGVRLGRRLERFRIVGPERDDGISKPPVASDVPFYNRSLLEGRHAGAIKCANSQHVGAIFTRYCTESDFSDLVGKSMGGLFQGRAKTACSSTAQAPGMIG